MSLIPRPTQKIVIGIDPGGSGGISFFNMDEGLIEVYAMPKTEHDVSSLIEDYLDLSAKAICYLEKVHAMPKQGVTSVFTFGRNYGFLRGLLTAHRIPWIDVTPNKWQKHLGCQTKGDKNVTKAAAQQLFPDTKITHAKADALLIGHYGVLMEKGA